MLPRRRLRPVALVATFVIALAQTAAIAYACTRSEASAPTASAPFVPCEAHRNQGDATDAGGDNLCEVHCQATPLPSPGVAAMAPPPGDALTVPEPVLVAVGVDARAPDAKSAAPPPREQYCRLQL